MRMSCARSSQRNGSRRLKCSRGNNARRDMPCEPAASSLSWLVVLAGCATPEPATPTTEQQIATVQPQRLLVKRRMERPVRTTVPDVRSPLEVQVARNVTAILQGIAELERLAADNAGRRPR